ncbi:MAG: hypothetical protein RLY23_773, partial [Actinomycetota bacterium]
MPSDSVQTISNGEITLSLYADSTFSLQFGETDYSLKQMRATASIGGSELFPIGDWLIDGNTARCGGENGTPVIEIAIDEEQPGACSMSVSVSPLVETVLDRFTITGAATGKFATRLVEGYDSWSWAGVRRANAPGRSWWRSAFVGSLATITASARTANRFVTAINWNDGEITIESAGAPVLSAIPDTWGFTAG